MNSNIPPQSNRAPTAQQVKLSALQIDRGTQLRAKIDGDIVNEYADGYARGDAFPPVDVFQDGERYILADGFHRYYASRQCEAKTILANIRPGGLPEAMRHAIRANRHHGLRRTNEDKRNAVLAALNEWPDQSDRQIAAECGVTHPFVATIRRPAPPQVVTVTTSEPVQHPPAVDETGWPVPAHLLKLWYRAPEAVEKVQWLRQFLARMKDIQENGHPQNLYAEVNLREQCDSLTRCIANYSLAIPYAVCVCHGENSQNCRLCRGRGILSKFSWEKRATESDRAERKRLLASPNEQPA